MNVRTLLVVVCLLVSIFGCSNGIYGPRAVSDERYKILVDIIEEKLPECRYRLRDKETQAAITQYHRLKKK